LLLVLDTKDQ